MTGGTGFVGANLVRRLLGDGHSVHLLVRPNSNRWRLQDIQTEVVLHEVSLQDREALVQLFHQIRPDWIFHLAVHGAYSYQTDLDAIVQTNILGTINLVEASLQTGFEAFVNTGSSSEYGFKNHAPSETEWLEPNSHYAVTKASATLFCRFTAQSKGVRIPTLRLYSVYGPYEEPTRLMPALIVRGLNHELPPLVNPDIARDYIYTEDVIDAYLQAATQPKQDLGAVYNVGTGIQTSLRQAVAVTQRALNLTVEPVWGSMPDRQWDSTVWVADNRKLQTDLGWKPHHTFEQGFAQTVNWFRTHPNLIRFYETAMQKKR